MRIMILSVGRSGTSYLARTLEKFLPTYHYHGKIEPFSDTHSTDYDSKVKEYANKSNCILKFQLNQFHTQWRDSPKRIVKLFDMPWYVIVLIRRNIFKNTLSLCTAERTRQWGPNDLWRQVTIDEEHFARTLNGMWRWQCNIADHEPYKIHYNKIMYFESLKFIANTTDPMPNKKEQVLNYSALEKLSRNVAKDWKHNLIELDGYVIKKFLEHP